MGHTMKVLGWSLRALIAIDFALFILTFVPAFSGIGQQPGLADRLWGDYRLGGWRGDVVWVFGSTLAIFVLGMVFAVCSSKSERDYKITIGLWAIWLICFCDYAFHIVIHMMG
jgi:hypothetical protein